MVYLQQVAGSTSLFCLMMNISALAFLPIHPWAGATQKTKSENKEISITVVVKELLENNTYKVKVKFIFISIRIAFCITNCKGYFLTSPKL